MTGFDSVYLLNLASNLHLVDLLPYVGDGFRASAAAQVCQPVHVLDGAQDVVVIDGFAVFSRFHHGADKDRRDVVDGCTLVLVPLHDQKAVVVLRPRRVRHQMRL